MLRAPQPQMAQAAEPRRLPCAHRAWPPAKSRAGSIGGQKLLTSYTSGKRDNVHIAPLKSRVILSMPQPLTIFISTSQNLYQPVPHRTRFFLPRSEEEPEQHSIAEVIACLRNAYLPITRYALKPGPRQSASPGYAMMNATGRSSLPLADRRSDPGCAAHPSPRAAPDR